MGGFSWLVPRPTAAGDPTHALFAGQSHSIVDNLVALFEHSRAWNCSTADACMGYSAPVVARPKTCVSRQNYSGANTWIGSNDVARSGKHCTGRGSSPFWP